MLVTYCTASTELACLLQMFFSQTTHAEVPEPLSDHPMEKRIFWRESVGLPFVTAGFFEFT